MASRDGGAGREPREPRMKQILCLNRDCREVLTVEAEPALGDEWLACPECEVEYNSTCAPALKWLMKRDTLA